ncbi:MAG: site-specific DNA-methyltransferase [Acidimicrobiaceae bacterium]|nr:site-specific DNA-methyltransferase [Acidimicrobiaceae bacterium]
MNSNPMTSANGARQGSPALRRIELGSPTGLSTVVAAVPPQLLDRVAAQPQRGFPAIAKEPEACAAITRAVQSLPSAHVIQLGDSRRLELAPESIELVVTSPPYWTLKEYNDQPGQLGQVADYEEFLDGLDEVWQHVHRALVPGGRMVVVVGDVNVSRKAFGRHLVFPLHASIQERCRNMGFDNLAPIIWHKIANAKYEMGAGGFYGKPYEPNGVIKNDIEYILLQRKPGGYRKPELATRLMSIIPAEEHADWFQQIWRITGASTRNHPAPFPLSLAVRLIRMFSFVGDTVYDPFLGTGTASAAAAIWGRNSIGCEIDPAYFAHAASRVQDTIGASSQLTLDRSA